MREKKCQHAQRYVDEEDCSPAKAGDQHTAERWTESSADRGHRCEQPHGAAGLCFWNRLADIRQREGQHDRCAEALRRAGRDQQPERWSDAAQNRGRCEQEDPGQQQPSPPSDIAEPSNTDEQCCGAEEIREDDPLDFLERGAEDLRQGRQGDVGDAGAQRGQEHGERKAGERPPNRRRLLCASSVDLISSIPADAPEALMGMVHS